ncbi:hypothetical protein C8F01DRAFT_1120332 [Mycena amicta]|nr:hypothetical protein C8F01DRAFT_1120332 [Mycena amicta]
MFKRVDKRRKRQEEEEELGIDGEMKEVLGLNDTDSDESDTDSEHSDSEEEDADNQDADASSDEDEELPPITLEDALKDPIFVISTEPDVKGCVLCLGKLLKSPDFVSIHVASKAHQRRLTKFTAYTTSTSAAPDSSAWDVLRAWTEKQEAEVSPLTAEDSKRNEKREQIRSAKKVKAQAKQKAEAKQRKEEKAKAKAEAEGGSDGAQNEQKEKTKKRKADDGEDASPKKKRKQKDAADGDSGLPSKKKRKVKGPAGDQERQSRWPSAPTAIPSFKKPNKRRSPRSERLERLGKTTVKSKSKERNVKGGRNKSNPKATKSQSLQIFD